MSLWGWILLASLAAFATKLAGHLVPGRWLSGPRMARVTGTITIGLLASLTVMNTFAGNGGLARRPHRRAAGGARRWRCECRSRRGRDRRGGGRPAALAGLP